MIKNTLKQLCMIVIAGALFLGAPLSAVFQEEIATLLIELERTGMTSSTVSKLESLRNNIESLTMTKVADLELPITFISKLAEVKTAAIEAGSQEKFSKVYVDLIAAIEKKLQTFIKETTDNNERNIATQALKKLPAKPKLELWGPVLNDLDGIIIVAPGGQEQAAAAIEIKNNFEKTKYRNFKAADWQRFAMWGQQQVNSTAFNAFIVKLLSWGGSSGALSTTLGNLYAGFKAAGMPL